MLIALSLRVVRGRASLPICFGLSLAEAPIRWTSAFGGRRAGMCFSPGRHARLGVEGRSRDQEGKDDEPEEYSEQTHRWLSPRIEAISRLSAAKRLT